MAGANGIALAGANIQCAYLSCASALSMAGANIQCAYMHVHMSAQSLPRSLRSHDKNVIALSLRSHCALMLSVPAYLSALELRQRLVHGSDGNTQQGQGVGHLRQACSMHVYVCSCMCIVHL